MRMPEPVYTDDGREVRVARELWEQMTSDISELEAERDLLETKVAEYEAGRHPDDQFLAVLDRAAALEAERDRLREALQYIADSLTHPETDHAWVSEAKSLARNALSQPPNEQEGSA